MTINGWWNNKSISWEKSTGPNLTDRSKLGTKGSLFVEGQGIPLGITVDGANRHNMKTTRATLESMIILDNCHHHHENYNNISALTRVMTILK